MTDIPSSSTVQHHCSPAKVTFSNTFLGLTVQLSLFTALIMIAFNVAPIFFNVGNLSNLLNQSIPYFIIALALVLPARLKRIDLSSGAVFATSGWMFASFVSENMLVTGLILALVVGLALGTVNGTMQSFIRLNTAALTMTVSAAVSFGISLMLGWGTKVLWNGKPVIARLTGMDITISGVVTFIVALVLVLGLLYFTKLGGDGMLQKRHVLTAYTVSGMLFAAAACYLVMRLNMGGPRLADSSDVLCCLFITGTILMNKSDKVRFIPMACALTAALNWNVISNIFALNGMNTFHQLELQLLLTAAVIIPAFFVQRGSRPRF